MTEAYDKVHGDEVSMGDWVINDSPWSSKTGTRSGCQNRQSCTGCNSITTYDNRTLMLTSDVESFDIDNEFRVKVVKEGRGKYFRKTNKLDSLQGFIGYFNNDASNRK